MEQKRAVASDPIDRRKFLGFAVAFAGSCVFYQAVNGSELLAGASKASRAKCFSILPMDGVIYGRSFLKMAQRRKFSDFHEAVKVAGRCGKPVWIGFS